MKYGIIPGIDKKVSRIGQGCMMLGEGEGQAESDRMLDLAWDSGITLYDHSEVYGGGACERAFGNWLDRRGLRDRVVILDKGCHPHGPEKRVTPEDLRADIETSLGRLGADHIDLWLFHRDDPAAAVGPLVETLNDLAASGKIRAFGGSNWTHQRIAEANEFAYAHNLQPMVASSPNFSLAEQIESPWGDDCITISGPENGDARAWYAEQGMAVLSWSSLARGFLSGRLTRTNLEDVRDQCEELVFRRYATDDNWTRLERAAELGKERGLTVAQIALAFVFHQPMKMFALVAAYTSEEFAANAAALDAELSQREIEWLDLGREDR